MTGFGTVGGSLMEEAPGGSTDGRASPGGRLWVSRESVGPVLAVVPGFLTFESRRLTLTEGV
jgi:hypothetical protein